jgi:hypothetical protein
VEAEAMQIDVPLNDLIKCASLTKNCGGVANFTCKNLGSDCVATGKWGPDVVGPFFANSYIDVVTQAEAEAMGLGASTATSEQGSPIVPLDQYLICAALTKQCGLGDANCINLGKACTHTGYWGQDFVMNFANNFKFSGNVTPEEAMNMKINKFDNLGCYKITDKGLFNIPGYYRKPGDPSGHICLDKGDNVTEANFDAFYDDFTHLDDWAANASQSIIKLSNTYATDCTRITDKAIYNVTDYQNDFSSGDRRKCTKRSGGAIVTFGTDMDTDTTFKNWANTAGATLVKADGT